MSNQQYDTTADLRGTLDAAQALSRELTAFLENTAHGSPKDPATGTNLFTDDAEGEIAEALLAARNAMWMVTGAATGVLGLNGGGQFGTRPSGVRQGGGYHGDGRGHQIPNGGPVPGAQPIGPIDGSGHPRVSDAR